MAIQDDEDISKPGLGQALLGYPRATSGLGTALSVAAVPVPARPKRVPGYTDSRTGEFIPLLPGVSPAAFAAQQSSPMENALAGYGAETLHMGRSLGNFLDKAASAVSGNPVPLMFKNPPEPDESYRNDLMANSAAARAGATLADEVNTLPAQMVGGELVGPLAKGIQGSGRLASMARVGIKAAGEGAAKGAVLPADDLYERLKNMGKEAGTEFLRKLLEGKS